MKIIGYIGEPATGKSTQMREILGNLRTIERDEMCKDGKFAYHHFPRQKTIVAGIYDSQVFSGTDRLSKAVGPEFRQWLTEKEADPDYEGYTLYWEGERFTNNPTLEHMFKTCDTTVFCLRASEEVLESRHGDRDNQNATWLKGMRTRVSNLCNKFPITLAPIQE